MKIAIVRGDYLSSWEISNSQYLFEHHDVTMFVGKFPVYKVVIPPQMKKVSLWSPADLNFGKVSRWKMAILNRLFVDAHVMFGLEEKLKGFDVAYVSETFYGFTHQCLQAKKKGYVKSVVSHASENTPFNNEGIWGKKAWKQQALKEMDKFVAITDEAQKVLIQEGCDPAKIVRAKPGVDLKIFHPMQISQFGPLRKNDNTKLLFVGRLVPEKGILRILEIFSKLSKNNPKLELVVADTGPLAPLVEKFARQNKNVFYLGRINNYQEMAKLYNSCDIYLHFSIGSKTWMEQYGFNLIEAMACGLPVVGLDWGSVKEVVGPGGCVVSMQEYAKILEKFVNNVKFRRETGQRALKLVRKEYDAYKHGRDLEKIFRETL